MQVDYPFIREVHSPISEKQLRPLDPRCEVVQFSSPLTESDLIKLSRFLVSYRDVPLGEARALMFCTWHCDGDDRIHVVRTDLLHTKREQLGSTPLAPLTSTLLD
jgi:hypothetical protein